jgi:hypothetical protein
MGKYSCGSVRTLAAMTLFACVVVGCKRDECIERRTEIVPRRFPVLGISLFGIRYLCTHSASGQPCRKVEVSLPRFVPTVYLQVGDSTARLLRVEREKFTTSIIEYLFAA